MLYKLIALTYVALASAGSVERVCGDLGKSGVGLDNIKGKVSQAIKRFGRDTTLEASCMSPWRGVNPQFASLT